MAKTHGPLLSINASGTVGKINTYSHRKTGNQVRYQRKQADALSFDQLVHRDKIFIIHKMWTLLSAAEKNSWKNSLPQENLPAYNKFIKYNLECFKNYTRPWKEYLVSRFETTINTINSPYADTWVQSSCYDGKAITFINHANQKKISLYMALSGKFLGEFTASADLTNPCPFAIGNGLLVVFNTSGNYFIEIFDIKSRSHIKTITLAGDITTVNRLAFANNLFWIPSMTSSSGFWSLNCLNAYTMTRYAQSGPAEGPMAHIKSGIFLYGLNYNNPQTILKFNTSTKAFTEYLNCGTDVVYDGIMAQNQKYIVRSADTTNNKLQIIYKTDPMTSAVISLSGTITGAVAASLADDILTILSTTGGGTLYKVNALTGQIISSSAYAGSYIGARGGFEFSPFILARTYGAGATCKIFLM